MRTNKISKLEVLLSKTVFLKILKARRVVFSLEKVAFSLERQVAFILIFVYHKQCFMKSIFTVYCYFFILKIKQKERKSNTDTLYEVVCLESESERERRKTTASPSVRLPQSGSQSSMIPSPPEDDEEEGKCWGERSFCYGMEDSEISGCYRGIDPGMWHLKYTQYF